MRKLLTNETLQFFRDAGERGGKARTPAKCEASRENLKKARAKRWAGRKK